MSVPFSLSRLTARGEKKAKTTIGQLTKDVVGGDGFEPPTLSV